MSAKAKAPVRSAREMIEAGEWALCWICLEVFGRKRETLRHCDTCGRAFCEGEHGNVLYRDGECVVCATQNSDRKRTKS